MSRHFEVDRWFVRLLTDTSFKIARETNVRPDDRSHGHRSFSRLCTLRSTCGSQVIRLEPLRLEHVHSRWPAFRLLWLRDISVVVVVVTFALSLLSSGVTHLAETSGVNFALTARFYCQDWPYRSTRWCSVWNRRVGRLSET